MSNEDIGYQTGRSHESTKHREYGPNDLGKNSTAKSKPAIVEVINHKLAVYDRNAPRVSDYTQSSHRSSRHRSHYKSSKSGGSEIGSGSDYYTSGGLHKGESITTPTELNSVSRGLTKKGYESSRILDATVRNSLEYSNEIADASSPPHKNNTFNNRSPSSKYHSHRPVETVLPFKDVSHASSLPYPVYEKPYPPTVDESDISFEGKQKYESMERQRAEGEFQRLQTERRHFGFDKLEPKGRELMVAPSSVYPEHVTSPIVPIAGQVHESYPNRYEARTVELEPIPRIDSGSKESSPAQISGSKTRTKSEVTSTKSTSLPKDGGKEAKKQSDPVPIHKLIGKFFAPSVLRKETKRNPKKDHTRSRDEPQHNHRPSSDLGNVKGTPSKGSSRGKESTGLSRHMNENTVRSRSNLHSRSRKSDRSTLEGDNETDVHSYAASESRSGDSERSDDTQWQELCSQFEEAQLDEIGLVTPPLDPTRQAIVDMIMEEFWAIFNQNWLPHVSQCAGGSSQNNSPQNNSDKGKSKESKNGASRGNGGKRKRVDKNEDGTELPPTKSSRYDEEGTSEDPKFACPFRKNDPSKYNVYSHRGCAISYWQKIHRLKEHLYRCHQAPIHCLRCWQTFKTQKQYREHSQAENACTRQPGNPPDGLTPEIERKLRSRKKPKPNPTDHERWVDIYKILFPSIVVEDIPSPYFEEPQLDTPLSPDSRNLENYEQYIRRELPQMVRRNIEDVVRREMQPIEEDFRRQMQPVAEAIMRNLVTTIQNCQEVLSRSYLEEKNDEPTAGPSVNISEAGTSRQPNDSTRDHNIPANLPEDDFLNAAFQPIPPTADNLFNQYSVNACPIPSSSQMIPSDSGYNSLPCQCTHTCTCNSIGGRPMAGSYSNELNMADFDLWGDYGDFDMN